jgi:hypothetical protein
LQALFVAGLHRKIKEGFYCVRCSMLCSHVLMRMTMKQVMKCIDQRHEEQAARPHC